MKNIVQEIFKTLKKETIDEFNQFYKKWRDTFFEGKTSENAKSTIKKLDELQKIHLTKLSENLEGLNENIEKDAEKYTKAITQEMKGLASSSIGEMVNRLNKAKDKLNNKKPKTYEPFDIMTESFNSLRQGLNFSTDFWQSMQKHILTDTTDIIKAQMKSFTEAAKIIILEFEEKE